jgi:hypothetical protein
LKKPSAFALGFFWQGHKDLNPEPTVLEVFPQGLFSIAPQQLFCSIALVTQI